MATYDGGKLMNNLAVLDVVNRRGWEKTLS